MVEAGRVEAAGRMERSQRRKDLGVGAARVRGMARVHRVCGVAGVCGGNEGPRPIPTGPAARASGRPAARHRKRRRVCGRGPPGPGRRTLGRPAPCAGHRSRARMRIPGSAVSACRPRPAAPASCPVACQRDADCPAAPAAAGGRGAEPAVEPFSTRARSPDPAATATPLAARRAAATATLIVRSCRTRPTSVPRGAWRWVFDVPSAVPTTRDALQRSRAPATAGRVPTAAQRPARHGGVRRERGRRESVRPTCA